ncbi:hypothetical protein RJ639_007846 [Escallonia herrerae]|uniref:F-box domain-containing protein n=1 Tax=Escallonia herrerae TaxID=1293975 RepID=A0AA88W4Y4_9ASTE|nr:hypothetical protein RJ639_007846 [Escallonia herrerae]
MSCATTATATAHGGTAITSVHPDIIEAHILTRLDGPTVASVTCASPQLHSLCTEEKLWRDICYTTWPSINDPRVRTAISTFPGGHRSFFSDSFPTLRHHSKSKVDHRRSLPTTELISAVDIHYRNELIYSKVDVTETVTSWFRCSPFLVDLLDQKERVATPVNVINDGDIFLAQLEQHMTLSWILIDPTWNRAANISSLKPVSVQRHWLTGEVELQFSTIMAGGSGRGSSGFVQCKVVVTCGGDEGGVLRMREVNMQMQDMDEKCLKGEEILVILQEGMGSGERRKGRRGEERERYEEYLEMKRERSERKKRREGKLNVVGVSVGFTILVTLILWIFGRLCTMLTR